MTKKILFLLIPIIFTAQSCDLFSSGDSSGSGSRGVFLSVDSGDSWHGGKGNEKLNLASVAISKIFIEAENPMNVVAASVSHGVIASADNGENWVTLLPNFSAFDVFINPSDPQEIFTSGRKGKLAAIYRSPDRGGTWIQVYNEPSGESAVTVLAFDGGNAKIMYAGLSNGTVLKSSDGGDTWHKFVSFRDRVTDISVTESGIYVLNAKTGFNHSTDDGETWSNIKIDKKVKVNNDLVIDELDGDTVYVGTDMGIYRSLDAGQTWSGLPLPASSKVSNVTAIERNPEDRNEIYAGVSSTIYRSYDDGANWRTVQLPTNRVIGDIAINPEEPNRVYAGLGL